MCEIPHPLVSRAWSKVLRDVWADCLAILFRISILRSFFVFPNKIFPLSARHDTCGREGPLLFIGATIKKSITDYHESILFPPFLCCTIINCIINAIITLYLNKEIVCMSGMQYAGLKQALALLISSGHLFLRGGFAFSHGGVTVWHVLVQWHSHTVLFSEVTLDEIIHPFWVRGMLGEGLDHEQIPISPFWEKLKKPLFYYKKCSRLRPQ